MAVAVGLPIFVWDWPTCCKVFSILAPVPQTSLVPPAIVTYKSIQCFSKAAHSWKTIGSLFLIRDRPMGVPGMQWRMVGPGVGRHWLGQNVRTWKVQPSKPRTGWQHGQRCSPAECSHPGLLLQWASKGRWQSLKTSPGNMRQEDAQNMEFRIGGGRTNPGLGDLDSDSNHNFSIY